ncbi:MAG: DUF2628 domain-containing protein [Rhodobacteraceae bacterium]|nr:DUF2628 domain-containing protein [Paracoccaceae bacterium]
MSTYFVMAPPDLQDPVVSPREADRMVFVPDHFSWGAFFLSLVWLAFHGMWGVLVMFLVGGVAIEIAASFAGGDAAPTIATFALLLLLGFEANSLRRWTMERQGWTCLGLACGEDQSEAELRFFNKLQAEEAGLPQDPISAPIVRPSSIVPRIGTQLVVGMKLGQETNR